MISSPFTARLMCTVFMLFLGVIEADAEEETIKRVSTTSIITPLLLSPSEFDFRILNSSLTRPWGLAFLPDTRILVSQKEGSMLILSSDGSTIQANISGLPPVLANGQGGLLDVALDPDFGSDPWIYWTYSEAGVNEEVGLIGTAVARGRLVGTGLQEVEVIYRQVPKVSGTGHYGSRLAFRNDKTLFVTLGERQKGAPAQDLTTTLGKVIRINRNVRHGCLSQI
jgi:glucose/arabinose dehydrogenase